MLLTDIDSEALEEVRAAIGPSASTSTSDVTSEADWIAALRQVEERHGRLDVLVNSAGTEAGSGMQSPEHLVIEDWRRVMAVNVEGIVLGCKHVIPLMRLSGGGAIVNIASVAGCVATPTAYGASKAAVIHTTQSVAAYCGRNGDRTRCNCILPGVIATPMMERFRRRLEREQNLSTVEARHRFLSRIPLGRFQQPDDIADAALFLASAQASQTTRVQLPVDGGFLLHDQ